MSSTDIVIAVYGSADLLKRCLFALGNTVPTGEAEVFIVDDATPPDRAEGLDDLFARMPSSYHLTRSTENHGFAGTNNIGVAQGNSPYVCLMNSDVEVQLGWLEAMTQLLDTRPAIGAVGARLVYPPWSQAEGRPRGRTQHAGVVFNIERMPYHIFHGWHPDHPKVNHFRIMQAVTGALLMVRRELYEDMGGLDEKYGQGNFEDIALCLNLKRLRYQIAYEPRALAWHYGSGSNNTADVEKNARLFIADWLDFIEPDDWYYW